MDCSWCWCAKCSIEVPGSIVGLNGGDGHIKVARLPPHSSIDVLKLRMHETKLYRAFFTLLRLTRELCGPVGLLLRTNTPRYPPLQAFERAWICSRRRLS